LGAIAIHGKTDRSKNLFILPDQKLVEAFTGKENVPSYTPCFNRISLKV
jgi:hypothetical protein